MEIEVYASFLNEIDKEAHLVLNPGDFIGQSDDALLSKLYTVQL